MDERPIGIFDSGVGGLTVVDKVMRLMPDEKIIYFGDTARVPYGNKSKETVTRFSKEIADFLRKFRVKVIIVACNTASSLSLGALKKSFNVPVMGVITPGVKEALAATRNNRIGVIGTDATVRSGAYKKEIITAGKRTFVAQAACPLFVPLAENRLFEGDIAMRIARLYLKPLLAKKVDTIILGCTHYPLLKKAIRKVAGKRVTLIDSSSAVARYVKEFLAKKNMRTPYAGKKAIFFASDNTNDFSKLAKVFLKRNIKARRAIL